MTFERHASSFLLHLRLRRKGNRRSSTVAPARVQTHTSKQAPEYPRAHLAGGLVQLQS